MAPDFDKSKIYKVDYDGTTEKGNVGAASIFTAHPEVKTWLVTGANEEGTVGAVRALESAAWIRMLVRRTWWIPCQG
jgi:L-arabinose transport system substrate-binding protein